MIMIKTMATIQHSRNKLLVGTWTVVCTPTPKYAYTSQYTISMFFPRSSIVWEMLSKCKIGHSKYSLL